MKNIIGIIGIFVCLLGLGIILFGGIGWMLYEIYQVIFSNDSISGLYIFYLILKWFIRDIVAFIVGGFLFLLGRSMFNY